MLCATIVSGGNSPEYGAEEWQAASAQIGDSALPR